MNPTLTGETSLLPSVFQTYRSSYTPESPSLGPHRWGSCPMSPSRPHERSGVTPLLFADASATARKSIANCDIPDFPTPGSTRSSAARGCPWERGPPARASAAAAPRCPAREPVHEPERRRERRAWLPARSRRAPALSPHRSAT